MQAPSPSREPYSLLDWFCEGLVICAALLYSRLFFPSLRLSDQGFFFKIETGCLGRPVLFLGGRILPASKRATFLLLTVSITNKMQGGPLMQATRGPKPPRPRWLLVSVLTAWLSLPAQAQAPQTQPSTRNSSEVSFHVGIKNGKSQFYLGEVIPLELTFTSKMPKRYQINMARYDRSGRMSYEQFSVNPDGSWGDPLRSYFNSSMGWMGGGLTGFEFLSESPTKISLELNEVCPKESLRSPMSPRSRPSLTTTISRPCSFRPSFT